MIVDIAYVLTAAPDWQGCRWSLSGDDYAGLDWDAHNPMPKPTLDELEAAYEQVLVTMGWANLRAKRNARLAACDWTQLPDAGVDAAAWVTYRQALRDLPEVTSDPLAPVWPVPPA